MLLEFKLWLEGQQEDLALKILNNNQQALAQLHVTPKFLPVAAYFLAQGQNPNTINQYFNKVKELDDKKKITVNYTKDGINVDGKIVNWLTFTEIVDGKYNLTKPKPQNDVTNTITDKPLIDVNNIKIYESHSPQKCIKYGQGYSFCISRPGNTMWQSYRDFQTSTFYFVLDENRPKTDPLHIVVVDITENGVQLTDANNTTGSIAEFYEDHEKYFEYLRSKGIDTNIFKNIPKSEEEEKEQKLFGKENNDLNWFVKLPYDYKSKYIGRGHDLTNEQFDYLWENNVVELIQQYITIGHRLSYYQMYKIFEVNQFKKSYLNARSIAGVHSDDIVEQEFYEMTNEQKKRLTDTNISSLLNSADLDKREKIINDIINAKGKDLSDDAIKDILYHAGYTHTIFNDIAMKIAELKGRDLTSNNVYDILSGTSQKQKEVILNKIIELVGDKLDAEGITSVINYSKDKISTIKKLIDIKKDSLSNPEITYFANNLYDAKNNTDIINVILNYKKTKLSDSAIRAILNLMAYNSNEDYIEMVKRIIQLNGEELTDRDLWHMRHYAKPENKENVSKLIIDLMS